MSFYSTEHIQMIYDDHAPLTKMEKSKTKVTPIYSGSSDLNNAGTAYQVVWIDGRNRRFEITIRVSSDLIVKDFIQMVIGEFNQLFKREEIEEFFFANETFIYELYEIDSDQKPNEELPPYDDNQKLRKTNCSTFALKQTIMFLPSLMVSSMSDPQSCKSPISPRSEEEKINPYNKTIQNTDQFTQESDKLERGSEGETNWCLCCCQF